MSSTAKNLSGKLLSAVWLRRDLRLFDHAVLAEAARAGHPVQLLFIFDTQILARFQHKDDRRLSFIAQTLCRMHGQLHERGGGLIVLHGRPQQLVPEFCAALGIRQLYAAEDFEPQTRQRDDEVEKRFDGKTRFTRIMDHLLLAPDAVLKSDGTPFKVFTPYSRAWREKANKLKDFAAEAVIRELSFNGYSSALETLRKHGMEPLDPESGPEEMLGVLGYGLRLSDWPVNQARQRLHAFASKHLGDYKTQRDVMSADGTSRLSPYLRFGLLSVRECARIAFEAEAQGSHGASVWLNELIWRDFYAMILYHFPHTATQEMQAHYRNIQWSYDKNAFQRFIHGMTGYPVVDAAMRELLTTGYMHNRARMIVASFMTKDLLLDWRMGEEHFAQHLMDYELASNVGGWQWAASTGTDAQPYFRIFNPVLQGQRFDPEGNYVRRFVPELAHLRGKAIHEPWESELTTDYPARIVNHAEMKTKAIAMFKRASTV